MSTTDRQTKSKALITYSRTDAFKRCRRRHWFAYEVGLRSTLDAKALRMGHAYHAALEALVLALAAAIEAVRSVYKHCPEQIDLYDWQIERETVLRMVCGYAWRWGDETMEYIATEEPFRLPLKNPQTGKATPIFDFAGVVDGIVKLDDGRGAVLERKLQSESLDSDSPLWKRLQIDHQISLYVLAARRGNHDVSTVLYDAARKPTIKPTAVPMRDENGFKIVHDRHGIRQFTKQNKPRQTGDTKLGYELQSRPMTVQEWGEKLNEDIGQRPDWYFARIEVPRLDDELEECAQELWEIQQAIREAQRTHRWYRTCNRDTCAWCPYFGLCSSKWHPARDPVPDGFEIVSDVHPELGDDISQKRGVESNGDSN